MQEAAGYVVYHQGPEGRRFLLLRNADHHTWGFPKGKLDAGEDARAGARRELLEETAIADLEEDAGFACESVYTPRSHGGEPDDDAPRKRVRYFLGRVAEPDFRMSTEHDAADWMLPEEVLALLTHEDSKRVFREALARLARR